MMKVRKRASTTSRSEPAKTLTAASARRPSKKTAAARHLPKLRKVHPELRKMVDDFLKEKNIPLQVAKMHFSASVNGDQHCCTIDGETVCGSECP
jgi:hypothetical protein